MVKYNHYIDIIFFDQAMEFLENTGLNEHVIKLITDKQPLYGHIYTLNQGKIETLKSYIKTDLKTGFIDLLSLLQVPSYCLIKS